MKNAFHDMMHDMDTQSIWTVIFDSMFAEADEMVSP